MNKKQTTEKCREVLYRYNIGEKITDYDDIMFLISVFEGHSEWESKKGVGISYFSTMKTIYSKNKCFSIHRVDGSMTDISFNHSIKNRSRIIEIKNACRDAIRPTVTNFRIQQLLKRCPFTDELLTNDNLHIDHYDLTFDQLFKKWMENQDEEYLFGHINPTSDNNQRTYFALQVIIESFIKFHNENTHLRGVSKKANLSILKKI